jgi:hypothetical protein
VAIYIVFGVLPNGESSILHIYSSLDAAKHDKMLREKATAEGVPTDYSFYRIETWRVD